MVLSLFPIVLPKEQSLPVRQAPFFCQQIYLLCSIQQTNLFLRKKQLHYNPINNESNGLKRAVTYMIIAEFSNKSIGQREGGSPPMAKRIVATLLLLMLVFTTVATAFAKTAVSGTRYVTSTNGKPVNVRQGPGKGNRLAAIGSIAFGEQVSLQYKDKDSSGNIWYQVSYKGKTVGWMMGSFLTTKKPTPHTHSYSTTPSKIVKNQVIGYIEVNVDYCTGHLYPHTHYKLFYGDYYYYSCSCGDTKKTEENLHWGGHQHNKPKNVKKYP